MQIHHCAVLMLSGVLFPTKHLSKSIICRAEAREKVSEKNSISSYLGRLTFFKSKFLFVWIKNYVSVYCSRESFTGPCVVQPLESRTEYAMFCLKTVSLLFNFGQGSKISVIMANLVRLSSWLLLKNCILIVYFCLVELHVQFCLASTLQLLFSILKEIAWAFMSQFGLCERALVSGFQLSEHPLGIEKY